MTLLTLIEAFKIHKLRHERRIQLWFLLLYGIHLLVLLLPIGDQNFDALLSAYETILSGNGVPPPVWDVLTPGNWLYLGLLALTYLISAFFAFLYAVLFVSERDPQAQESAVFRLTLKALPPLILLGLILAIPAFLSALLLFLPLIIFAFMMYFLPLNLALGHQPLGQAMRSSFKQTRGKRLSLFFKVFLLSFLLSIPQSLVVPLASGSQVSYAILNSFFVVLQAFMQGRLMGILYLQLVKKQPVVIPSKPDVSG